MTGINSKKSFKINLPSYLVSEAENIVSVISLGVS